MSFLKSKLVVAPIIGFVLFLLLTLVVLWNPLKIYQLKFADNLYSPGEASDEIIIVDIDDRSIADDKLGPLNTWSRSNYARVISEINKYDPAIIGIDLLFINERDEVGDTALAEELSKVDTPVIIYKVESASIQNGEFYESSKDLLLNQPIDKFLAIEGIQIGTSNIFQDTDDVIRKMVPGILDSVNKEYYESFSFLIARNFLDSGSSISEPYIDNSKYLLSLSNGEEISIPLHDGQMAVNYFSDYKPENTDTPAGWESEYRYKTIPFLDIYNGNIEAYDPSSLKDKIVLIGVSAQAVNDLYFTSVSSKVRMPGVLIHANAIQTIIDQKFLRYLSLVEKLILLFVLCIGAAFTFIYTRIRWSLVVLGGFMVFYTISAYLLFQIGIITDVIHPYLAVISVFVASYMYRYFTEFREKSVLKGAFSKYVSPEIVKSIAEHPENLKLGGQKRNITVLFTDIVGFTSISEKLKPESLVALLNEYFDAMEQVIKSEGGTLDKFEGDAIMAFFGAPLAQEDHAVRACRCAVKMQQSLVDLKAKWQEAPPLPGGENRPDIDFRCGISTGKVIVGNIGASDRFNYTAIGDSVNLASRLESANKRYETRIMISESTMNETSKLFWVRELDKIKVVGKKKPTVIYELLGQKIETPKEAVHLLQAYNKGIELYHARKFAEGIDHFKEILKKYPNDGPSKKYLQRCEVLKDFPPADDWDGVFEMKTK